VWTNSRPLLVHPKGWNVSFTDSHVTFMKALELVGQNDAVRCRWNNDHQPHPETQY
jgi:hypothetical protein